jgi:hypothetical protein
MPNYILYYDVIVYPIGDLEGKFALGANEEVVRDESPAASPVEVGV